MKRRMQILNFRERMFKWFFFAGDRYRLFLTGFLGLCRFVINVSYALFITGFIFYTGFRTSQEISAGLTSSFRIMFSVIFFAKYLPGFLKPQKKISISILPRSLIFIYTTGVFLSVIGLIKPEGYLTPVLHGTEPVIAGIFLMGITELSGMMRTVSSVRIPPALIFSASFLILILAGSGLLMMPRAHDGSLTYLNALFTSVSAVCVTGLTVVDTSTVFTTYGQTIILLLIQAGGLGIMTFTGFFGYIFMTSSSFRDRLLLKELFSADTMNNLFKLLSKIIIFTLLIESAGALIIFHSIDQNGTDRLLFSVFHSVSAFCNAGFSTLPANLNSPGFSDNITLQLTIASLIVLGGLGFPVLLGLYGSLKYYLAIIIRKFRGRLKPIKPVRKNVSTGIVMLMTLILITGGAILYNLFESEKSLKGMDTASRIIFSLFGSISARTAGFNITDISAWGYPTVFLMIFLMWIGASPGSTGGGIKTTTFALALRNTWNFLRGRDILIIGNREISGRTITRVLTIIFLSLSVISAGFLALLIVEPTKNPVSLLFECFSAFGTVGLSLADSSTFSDSGKVTDIILMFIGRVGPLTLLAGLFTTVQKGQLKYPDIDILIN